MPAARRWLGAALVLLGMTLACVPWTIRNHRALGGLFFLRSNFGLELRMGNHEGAGANLALSARGGTERHPRTNEDEARKVKELGELAYMRAAGREARAGSAPTPRSSSGSRRSGSRSSGSGRSTTPWRRSGSASSRSSPLVGAWRAFPGLVAARRAALLVPFLLFPLVYYVVGFEARYRQPLDGSRFSSRRARSSRRERGAAARPA